MKALMLAPLFAITAVAAVAQAAPIEGEIRKVDGAGDKVTIRHGPIEKWDMPGMTMVFRVASKAMLEGLQVGDKVRFDAERGGGAMTITRIDKTP